MQDLYFLLPASELFAIFKRLSTHGNHVSGLSSTLHTRLHTAELKKRDEIYSVCFLSLLKWTFDLKVIEG